MPVIYSHQPGEGASHTENEELFIKMLKEAVESEFINVRPCYSIYGYLKWINIYASSSIKEELRGVLYGKDSLGRNRYDFLTIYWKPHGKYREQIHVQPNTYTKKSNGERLFNATEKFFDWDVIYQYKLYDYNCQENLIAGQTMSSIISHIKDAVDNYKI